MSECSQSEDVARSLLKLGGEACSARVGRTLEDEDGSLQRLVLDDDAERVEMCRGDTWAMQEMAETAGMFRESRTWTSCGSQEVPMLPR